MSAGGLVYPDADPVRPGRRLEGGDARGLAWVEPPAAVHAELPRWVRRDVGDAESLKRTAVWRAGELVLKYFPRPAWPARWLRPSRARRSARAYFRILPLRSPRPLLAVDRVAGGGSLLVSEFVAGPLLHEAWRSSPEARAALPALLATMHRRGVLHGDLHPKNLVWSRGAWCLLDVDGLRHALHSRSRVFFGQWARLVVYLGESDGLEAAYREYAAAVGEADPDAGWRRIRERAEAVLRARRRPPRTRLGPG